MTTIRKLEAKDKEIEYLKHCEKAREEETEGWERLKVIAEENYPIEKIVGRDVSLVIEKLFKELKSQLQEAKADYESIKITLGHYERDIREAKAEVERLEKELKYCDVEPEEDDFERYSLPICFEPREELKELNLRKDRINREWEGWNERMSKIKSQLTQHKTEDK